MNIYWYWPWKHDGREGPLERAVVGPNDTLTIQCLSTRFGIPTPRSGSTYRIVPNIPEPSPTRIRSGPWLVSRAATYIQRARLRDIELARGNYDVCHIHSLNQFTDWAVLPRAAHRCALVSTVHDVVPHQSRLPTRPERALLKSQYNRGGILIVAHSWMRRRLVVDFDIPPEKTAIVPLPVEQVQPIPDIVPSEDHPAVLFFGTLRRNKGLEVLLDAIKELRDLEHLRFILAGAGDPELMAAAQAASNRDPRIRIEMEYISSERKAELFSSASLIVLPYTSFASQSAVLGDAYSYRCPVVVTDVGALGETVKEESTGWVVPPGDPSALADALREAIEDVDGRRRAAGAMDVAATARRPEQIGSLLREVYAMAVE